MTLTGEYRSGALRAHYPEFIRRVRDFDPDELLAAVAASSGSLSLDFDPDTWIPTPPWALAAIAKEAVLKLAADQHRQTRRGRPRRLRSANRNAVAELCDLYNQVVVLSHDEPLFAFFTRTGQEQFTFQQSPYSEMARTHAIFDQALRGHETEALNVAVVESILGSPIGRATNAAMVLTTSAWRNGGYFDEKWLDQPNFHELLKRIPRSDILAATEYFTATPAQFQSATAAASRRQRIPSELQKHAYNGLRGTPFIKVSDGRLLAPVHHLIPNRASPTGVYYSGLAQDRGAQFTTDVGKLFERYVGMQLCALAGADVQPEQPYDKGQQKTVDWTVVLDDVVLLVEVKATRLDVLQRAGGTTLNQRIDAVIGAGYRKCEETASMIESGHDAMKHVPKSLPRLGLVVTLEPYFQMNSTYGRLVADSASMPVMTASIAELEKIVGYGESVPLGPTLLQVFNDEDRRHRNFGHAFSGLGLTGSNTILQTAWDAQPIDA